MRDIRDLLDGVRAAPAPGAAPGRERRKKAARKIQRDRGGGVAEQFKVFQSSDAIQEGNIFEGIEFCVMPSSRYRKQDIEELIVRNGGYCVGAPAVKDGLGTVIIAGNETFQVKNHIASGRYDVLDVSFILESVERGEQVAMAPHYFIFMTDATARELRKTTDVFGDHLWEDTDAQTLKRVFDEVTKRQLGETKHVDVRLTWPACCVRADRPPGELGDVACKADPRSRRCGNGGSDCRGGRGRR